MSTLVIKDLHCEIEGKKILKGVNLTLSTGEIHAVMGPNGTGKSTLSSVIMGHPKYVVTQGEILLDGENVLEMEVDERAKAGLFLAMQYPAEVSGVTNSDFLRTARNAVKEESLNLFRFIKKMNESIDLLQMDKDMETRYLNEGFSGGEKKRNEILQMLMLEPKIAILDEIDSGLDIDALRIVGNAVRAMAEEKKDDFGVLMITHYQRLLDYIEPDHVHIMMNGRIVRSGDASLALRLENEGYDWLKEELGIQDEDRIEN